MWRMPDLLSLSTVLLPSFGKINQYNIRVVPQAVKYDLFAIRGDVEGPHGIGIVEMSKQTSLHCREIEQPEILRQKQSLHVDQALSVWQKTGTNGMATHPDCRQIHAGSIGTNGKQRSRSGDVGSGIHN